MADQAYRLLDKLAERPENRDAMRRASMALDLGRLAFGMREARGLTQRQVAERVETSRTVISRLEGGNAGRVPGLDQIQKIAEACGFELRLEAERVRPETVAQKPKAGFSVAFANADPSPVNTTAGR
ncbi:helix-turn-helix transcriptional regulator [Spiribacter halobius]|uniref:HTH cro/C1-type domain-containing protein n=1 Tax=Sediminicurvatus halobius TaxID=2182432 RepID=A0A2U2MVU1_9GAMM|nr:helix-turn-helix transcriptional regulator [Spiribacter halobius]PWG60975.1 hypothetical protein DEM34_18830 [Spiribacter halobius]UEX77260.1 helix-turn-helix domain-containing protein [Spiribacter halobius]